VRHRLSTLTVSGAPHKTQTDAERIAQSRSFQRCTACQRTSTARPLLRGRVLASQSSIAHGTSVLADRPCPYLTSSLGELSEAGAPRQRTQHHWRPRVILPSCTRQRFKPTKSPMMAIAKTPTRASECSSFGKPFLSSRPVGGVNMELETCEARARVRNDTLRRCTSSRSFRPRFPSRRGPSTTSFSASYGAYPPCFAGPLAYAAAEHPRVSSAWDPSAGTRRNLPRTPPLKARRQAQQKPTANPYIPASTPHPFIRWLRAPRRGWSKLPCKAPSV
jgi:hypothetical protein